MGNAVPCEKAKSSAESAGQFHRGRVWSSDSRVEGQQDQGVAKAPEQRLLCRLGEQEGRLTCKDSRLTTRMSRVRSDSLPRGFAWTGYTLWCHGSNPARLEKRPLTGIARRCMYVMIAGRQTGEPGRYHYARLKGYKELAISLLPYSQAEQKRASGFLKIHDSEQQAEEHKDCGATRTVP